MSDLDEEHWVQAFAVELLRLGMRARVDQVIEVGRGFYATEGSDDPVEVARRVFLTKLPDTH